MPIAINQSLADIGNTSNALRTIASWYDKNNNTNDATVAYQTYLFVNISFLRKLPLPVELMLNA